MQPLMVAGADPFALNSKGDTPVRLACQGYLQKIQIGSVTEQRGMLVAYAALYPAFKALSKPTRDRILAFVWWEPDLVAYLRVLESTDHFHKFVNNTLEAETKRLQATKRDEQKRPSGPVQRAAPVTPHHTRLQENIPAIPAPPPSPVKQRRCSIS